jgi:hypothetical protein
LKNKLLTTNNDLIKLRNELLISKKIIEKNKLKIKFSEFVRLEPIYGKKCRKNFFNQLYQLGSDEYRKCVLNKGPNKKN